MQTVLLFHKSIPLYVGITIENVIYFISFITLHGLPATEIFGITLYYQYEYHSQAFNHDRISKFSFTSL